jgi:hypothetical protein
MIQQIIHFSFYFFCSSFSGKRNGAKLEKQNFNNIYYSLLPQQKKVKSQEQKLSFKNFFFVFFSLKVV